MRLRVLVFVVGASSLGAEIAAARLLAPWFGASTIVWANTIATVLVALSIGYAVGGRLADRNPTLTGLSHIVLIAAAMLAVVPFLSGPFLRLSVDAFDSLSAGVFLGSLVGVSVLIAVPVLLLGMVSPYAVKLSLGGVNALDTAGRTTGRLYALSTVGSLAGTFLAALLLIPVVGSRRTFLIFALSLALTALLCARSKMPAGVVALGIAGLIALPTTTLKTTGASKVIWERESDYQYARVLEASDGTRTLELNEGQAVHSKYTPGRYLTDGYWDDLTVLGLTGRETNRVAILGSAAGTSARAIGFYSPTTRIDAVEIDHDITDVGRRLFDLKAPRLRTHDADARPWLRSSPGNFDAILVDAYRQPYIPFYLATREFFTLVRSRLAPGGVMAINVGHPEQSPELEQVLSATARAVFPHVWRDPVDATNTMLVATVDGDPKHRLAELGADSRAELAPVAMRTRSRLAPTLRGGHVFTDDLAPVEWLVDLSLAAAAD